MGTSEEQEDIIAVRVENDNWKEKDMWLIICYMGVEKGRIEREDNERRYNIMSRIIRECREEVIVMGDMNGHIGLLGEKINNNGELLLDFCEENELEILNFTRVEWKPTWRGNDGKKSAIDYVLANGKIQNRIKRLWVDEEEEVEIRSDHNMMIVEIQSKRDAILESKEGNKVTGEKWNRRKARWDTFREDLKELEDSGEGGEEMEGRLKREIEKSAERNIGKVRMGGKRKRKPWWNEEIKNQRKRRKELNKHRKMLKRQYDRGEDIDIRTMDDAKEVYEIQRRTTRDVIAKAVGAWEREEMARIKQIHGEQSKEWYRWLKGENYEEVRVEKMVIMEKHYVGRDIQTGIEAYWKGLVGLREEDEGREWGFEMEERRLDRQELEKEVSIAEVRKSIQKLRRGKAAGLDGLPSEMFMEGGEKMERNIKLLMNKIMMEEKVPESWKEARVTLIPKGKGRDKGDIKNYRPVTVVNIISKIFTSIIQERLSREIEIEGALSDEQNAFRKGRRGTDNIYVLGEILEIKRRTKRTVWLAFLDIEKAFDLINRKALWKGLERIV